jgi:hypothetical protein
MVRSGLVPNVVRGPASWTTTLQAVWIIALQRSYCSYERLGYRHMSFANNGFRRLGICNAFRFTAIVILTQRLRRPVPCPPPKSYRLRSKLTPLHSY